MVYSVLVLEILENRKLIEVLESPGISFRRGVRGGGGLIILKQYLDYCLILDKWSC